MRTNPHIDAQTTGEILEFGAIFNSSKSIFIDGVNYVKLSDGSGWVFGKKGNTEVLQLLEVKRGIQKMHSVERSIGECTSNDTTAARKAFKQDDFRCITNHVDQSSNCVISNGEHPKPVGMGQELCDSSPRSVKKAPLSSSKTQRSELMYWKEVRLSCKSCTTFDQFSMVCQLASSALQSPPPSIPEPGPARSAWMSASSKMYDAARVGMKYGDGQPPLSISSTSSSPVSATRRDVSNRDESSSEQQIRTCISLIAALTHQVVTEGQLLSRSRSNSSKLASAMVGLEAHLWVLVNVRAGVAAHIMDLIVAAANSTFERMTAEQRNVVIEQCLLPLASITKQHCHFLGAKVGLLGDDIKNFIQRWVMIRLGASVQAYSEEALELTAASDLAPSAIQTTDRSPEPRAAADMRDASKGSPSKAQSAVSELIDWVRGASSLSQQFLAVQNVHTPLNMLSKGSQRSVCGSEGSTDTARCVVRIFPTSSSSSLRIITSHHHFASSSKIECLPCCLPCCCARVCSDGSSSSSGSRLSQFFADCDREVRKFVADPDYQWAGMI